MQRLVKNVTRVTFKLGNSDEVNTVEVVAKSKAEAFGEVIARYGIDIHFLDMENLGARIAVVDDAEFYRIAKFKEPKID